METEENELAYKLLLGKLSDDEQAALEQDYFQNTSSFENLLIAENSLTDAYVSGRLSPEDRIRFERRLLMNPRQQQRAAFAETLIKYASRLPVQDLDPSASSWSAVFARLLSGHRVLSYSLAAIVFVFFAGALLLWMLKVASPSPDQDLARTQTPREIEIPSSDTANPADAIEAPLNDGQSNAEHTPKRDPGQPSTRREPSQNRPAPMISTIILPLASTRGAGPATTFVVPEEANFVKVQLPFEAGDFSSYFVVVETVDGQQVWKGKVVKLGGNNHRKTVTVTIPASRLSKGDYIITLKGLGKAGAYEAVGEYSLTLDMERPVLKR